MQLHQHSAMITKGVLVGTTGLSLPGHDEFITCGADSVLQKQATCRTAEIITIDLCRVALVSHGPTSTVGHIIIGDGPQAIVHIGVHAQTLTTTRHGVTADRVVIVRTSSIDTIPQATKGVIGEGRVMCVS